MVIATIYQSLFDCNFAVFDDADVARRYYRCRGREGQSLARRTLREIYVRSGLFGPIRNAADQQRVHGAVRKRIERAGGNMKARERNRKPDDTRQNAWAELMTYIGGAMKHEQRNGPRKEGEDTFKDTVSRATLLFWLFRQETLDGKPTFKQDCERIWATHLGSDAPFPTVKTILAKLTAYFGNADRLEEADEHHREMGGCFEAKHAMQAIGLDATTLDCSVANAWGENFNGKPRRWAACMIDVASGKQWMYAPNCGNEAALWTDMDAVTWLFKQLQVAPEYVYTDRVGSLFEGLSYLNPGEEIFMRRKRAVSKGVLALLACGIKVKLSTPHNPTGKAFCERGIGICKDQFAGIMAKRAMELERAGQLPDNAQDGRKPRRRWFSSETVFRQCADYLVDFVNNMPNFRGSGNTRNELSAMEYGRNREYFERRQLVANAWEVFEEKILPGIKIGIMQGREIISMGEGKKPFGHVKIPVDAELKDAVVLMIPGGLLASDKPELLRCYVIQQRHGLARIEYVEGEKYQVREFGYTGPVRTLDTYRLKPETPDERKRAAAGAAEKKYIEAAGIGQQSGIVAMKAAAPEANDLETSGPDIDDADYFDSGEMSPEAGAL